MCNFCWKLKIWNFEIIKKYRGKSYNMTIINNDSIILNLLFINNFIYLHILLAYFLIIIMKRGVKSKLKQEISGKDYTI